MSAPRGNTPAPTGTPRRSGRLSNKTNSVAEESAITNFTSGGTKQRRSVAALTKVQPRRSNAYGAAGRMGQPERVTVASTGFAQAFQNQRGNAFNGGEGVQVEEEESSEDEEEENAVDPAGQPSTFTQNMRNAARISPKPTHRSSPQQSQVTPGYSFIDSHDSSPSDDDDLAESMANTTKSFGPSHEAGMLISQGQSEARFPFQHESGTPSLSTAARRGVPSRALNGLNGPRLQANAPSQAQAPRTQVPTRAQMPPPTRTPINAPIRGSAQTGVNAQSAARSTPAERNAIGQSVDELIAEESARLQREGLPRSQQSGRQSEKRRPHQRDAQEVDEWLGNVQPLENKESVWNWKKLLTWALPAMTVFMLLVWSISSLPSPGLPEDAPSTPGVVKSAIYRVANARDKLAEFINPYPIPFEPTYEQIAAYQRKHGEDHFLWGRMTGMDQKYTKGFENMENKYTKSVNEMHEAFEELKKELPDLMIVRRHEDGSTEISDEFWRALISKARSKSDDPEWIRYLQDNKVKVDTLFDPAARKERSHTEVWAHAVTRDEFTMHIERQYQNITKLVEEKIKDATQDQSVQLKTLVEVEAKKAAVKNIRLSALAEANLVANYQLHLQKPNYFSAGLGAIIDKDMSSATFYDNANYFARLSRRLALVSDRNPPMSALTKWNEPGDCWCSAPAATKGQAQLAVSIARPMKPKQVTIEHIPKDMVPARNINNAPRDMELWVQTDAPIVPYFSNRHVACREPGPDPTWKCLGSFKYNIHATNYLQTFDLAAEPAEPVRRAMLRVTTNWGADHTCLYRVRLHGEDAMPDYEYSVGLMD